MRTFILLLLPLLCQLGAATGQADPLTDLRQENLLLKAELQLARSSKLYVLVDLARQEILLKAGGTTARRLALTDVTVTGIFPQVLPRRLATKTSFSTPRRPNAGAGATARPKPTAGADPVTALEISAMPINYRLILDDGTTLVVRSGDGNFLARLGQGWHLVENASRRTLLGLNRWRQDKPPVAELILTMAPAEARQLYWSFDEKSACLIRNPPTP